MGSLISRIRIPWGLRAYPIGNSGGRVQPAVFQQAPRWCWYTLKFEQHWFEAVVLNHGCISQQLEPCWGGEGLSSLTHISWIRISGRGFWAGIFLTSSSGNLTGKQDWGPLCSLNRAYRLYTAQGSFLELVLGGNGPSPGLWIPTLIHLEQLSSICFPPFALV